MNTIMTSLLVAVCIFASGLAGLYLNRLLPEHHLTKETQDVISRPGNAQAAARNAGDGRSGATRSHAQRALSRASMARLASTGPSPQ